MKDFTGFHYATWGYFSAQMLLDFAIRVKRGLITENKTFFKHLFKFLLKIDTEFLAVLFVICL